MAESIVSPKPQPTPEKPNGSLLRFEEVSVRFGADPLVLDRLSFNVCRGETRVIMGAAGSGKTIMLKTAMGLIRPESGRRISIRSRT